MKIHEYQAKRIFAEYGIPVPRGETASNPDQAQAAAERLGGEVVIKAQIHAGGRGKAGGIRKAATAREARHHAQALLGRPLVTPQTGPEGRVVRTVLVEETLPIARELYVGMAIDRSQERVVVIASPAGGVEIEEVAETHPESIFRVVVDPWTGLLAHQARQLAVRLGWSGELLRPAESLLLALYRLFVASDASLAEINPCVVTRDNRLIALDAKINLDDNALYRHENLRRLRDLDEEEPLEVEASEFRLNYIKLEGNVGCMVNGAGLAMSTMDIIQSAGGQPANFLDVGGGASAEQVQHAFRILLGDPHVKAVLINIFGGILRCDRLATGVVEAARELKLKVPVVIRLEGTNVEEGRKILRASGLNFIVAKDMKDAAEKVVELASRQ